MSPQTGYTVTEVAALLGVSRQQVWNLVQQGRLKVKEHEKTSGRGRLILDRGSVTRELKRRKG